MADIIASTSLIIDAFNFESSEMGEILGVLSNPTVELLSQKTDFLSLQQKLSTLSTPF